MFGGKDKAPRGWRADTGRAGRQPVAGCKYIVTPHDGRAPFTIFVSGRVQWALLALKDAAQEGCTPINQPAPRWSAYVHLLRGRGLPIETVTERHGGQFPGTHARYVLHATLQEVGKNG